MWKGESRVNLYKIIRYDDGRSVCLTREEYAPVSEKYRLAFCNPAGIAVRVEYFSDEKKAIEAFEKEKNDPTF